ncbi:MAG: formate dehydrogenase accessory sulfurtransferase FdhD [Bacillota bacterium]
MVLTEMLKTFSSIIISKSAPTTLAVKLACDLGVTLIGFARGKRMNLYTHAYRINGGKAR